MTRARIRKQMVAECIREMEVREGQGKAKETWEVKIKVFNERGGMLVKEAKDKKMVGQLVRLTKTRRQIQEQEQSESIRKLR